MVPPDWELDCELEPDPEPPPLPLPLPLPPELLSERVLPLSAAGELERVEGASDCVIRATGSSPPSEKATRLICSSASDFSTATSS